MAEISYKDLAASLAEWKGAEVPPVILICGDEFISKSALRSILDVLCPKEKRTFNYEAFEAADCNIAQVIESAQTYSFFSPKKVVGYLDAKLFFSKRDHASILQRAKDAHAKDNMKKAADTVLSLLGLLNLTLAEAALGDWRAPLSKETLIMEDDVWFNDILTYCVNEKRVVPPPEDNAALMERALEKGFPKGNCLIITVEIVDKRRKLYQVIQEAGIVIDCSMPKGNRQEDRKAQETLFRNTAADILAENGKSLDPAAFRELIEMTGFDLRTFANNIETLIDYVGQRERIQATDVRAVLSRTKEDPIFELTGAILDRQAGKAFASLASVLTAGLYPLQVLTAIVNQIRKLLIAKDFVESEAGKGWNAGMPFPVFKTTVMPAITACDQSLTEMISQWESVLMTPAKGKGRASAKKTETDLLMAKNSSNAYPLYQLLSKSANFDQEELVTALLLLDQADTRLKSTGQSAKLVLEHLIMQIIQKEAG